MKQSIHAAYKDGMAFEIRNQGHSFMVDSIPDFGGQNLGPSPKSLMLSGLAGCTGMDVVSILQKMGVPFEQFDIQIEAESASEHPHVYTRIHIEYIFRGDELNTSKIEKAISLSLEKYCPVAATLRHTAEITHSLTSSPA
ncbi:OsmC family protein [Spirochaeta dissipatitropha]